MAACTSLRLRLSSARPVDSLPCGIVAPKFQHWDRQASALIAEFDHVHLKDDTKFPFVLQCERIKIASNTGVA
jgi:hypothetical protein